MKQALGVSPLQTALMGLNIAIVVLVCLFGAFAYHQAMASPLTAMTRQDVQALKDATVLAKENHALLQQVLILMSRQNATLDQLLPALRDVVEVVTSLAAQNVRLRADIERRDATTKERQK